MLTANFPKIVGISREIPGIDACLTLASPSFHNDLSILGSWRNLSLGSEETMKIHEYQAKEILRRYGVPVQPGKVATTPEEAEAIAREFGVPVVIKAQ